MSDNSETYEHEGVIAQAIGDLGRIYEILWDLAEEEGRLPEWAASSLTAAESVGNARDVVIKLDAELRWALPVMKESGDGRA